MKLEDSVATLKNVGPERQKKLNKLGIYSIKNLIEYFPRDYQDRSKITAINEINSNDNYVFKAKLYGKPSLLTFGKTKIVKVNVQDNTGFLELVWFNQPYMKNVFKDNIEYIFAGKASVKMGKYVFESPDYEEVGSKELLSTARIIPIYPLTDKVSQKMLRALIKDALVLVENEITENLPKSIVDKYELCDRKYSINNLHFPESDEAFFKARNRLVFEELFLMQSALFRIKGFVKDGSGMNFSDVSLDKVMSLFPYDFTNAQKRVVEDIKNDFTSGFVMNRLIQGDVGSGKTAVAVVACNICVNNGFQAALMAPTEPLAVQHYKYFSEIFEQLGIKTALLTGSIKKKEKDKIKLLVSKGEVNILIGTHAVIQDDVAFSKLGLVITDEQHRFGVRQRAVLSEKGDRSHVLVMTATPIPRTLALILYGDLDISIIDELPPGRQPINTSAVNSSYHERIYAFIKKQVDLGRQAYIICSAIDESENEEIKSVVQYAEFLKTNVFLEYQVEILNGKMKASDKNDVMEKFANNEINILVSTTVIEVGINVPNATVMLIENAERFGLAQLHQLRGRVGRGAEQSYCILVSDSKSEETKERLKAMTDSNDGFVISELDLKLRGPGEFFGTKQHGLPEMKLANLYKDIGVLKDAQKAVEDIFNGNFQMATDDLIFLNETIDKLMFQNYENNLVL